MNRLQVIITFIILMISTISYTQTGYLFVKKGIKKKRVYTEGSMLQLRLENGDIIKGYITLLRNDSILINGYPIHKTFIKEILLPRKPKKPFPDIKTVGLITAGSVLTSLGLSLNNHQNRNEALIAGPIIGFAPLLINHFGGRFFRAIPRKRFRIGKKFRLQVLDFQIAPATQHRKPF